MVHTLLRKKMFHMCYHKSKYNNGLIVKLGHILSNVEERREEMSAVFRTSNKLDMDA